MLFRLLFACLLALTVFSALPIGGSAGVAIAATPGPQQEQPESGRDWLAAEAASFAETAAEPSALARDAVAALPAPGMELPPARAPQRHGTPALAGIERPPRAASLLG